MKTNLISVIKKSFDGLELLDFAKSSRKKTVMDRESMALMNRYISEYKRGDITKEVFAHRLSILAGLTKSEAYKRTKSLSANNVTAIGKGE